jgi:hypothetical protein
LPHSADVTTTDAGWIVVTRWIAVVIGTAGHRETVIQRVVAPSEGCDGVPVAGVADTRVVPSARVERAVSSLSARCLYHFGLDGLPGGTPPPAGLPWCDDDRIRTGDLGRDRAALWTRLSYATKGWNEKPPGPRCGAGGVEEWSFYPRRRRG